MWKETIFAWKALFSVVFRRVSRFFGCSGFCVSSSFIHLSHHRCRRRRFSLKSEIFLSTAMLVVRHETIENYLTFFSYFLMSWSVKWEFSSLLRLLFCNFRAMLPRWLRYEMFQFLSMFVFFSVSSHNSQNDLFSRAGPSRDFKWIFASTTRQIYQPIIIKKKQAEEKKFQ